jgi:integral membrane protein
MTKRLQTPQDHLRASGIIEGISFLLLLFIAMPLKYWAGMPEMVRFIGMAHGILFVWYALSLLLVLRIRKITFKQAALAMLASVIPFGTFYTDKKWFRHI